MRTVAEVITAFNAFPEVGLAALGERPMILAPHPDDESLGCGGLIAACCRQGRPPVVVILTDGAASHPGSERFPPSRLRQVRADEARAAVAFLGLPPEDLLFLGYPDSSLPVEGPAFHAAADAVAALAGRHACQVLIGPWLHDPHCDHEAAALIAAEAARLARRRLLSYPVWGWLLPPETILPVGDISGWRLDIAHDLDAKQQAIAAHASQHGGLIDDSPEGFTLPHHLLSIFERPVEVFIEG